MHRATQRSREGAERTSGGHNRVAQRQEREQKSKRQQRSRSRYDEQRDGDGDGDRIHGNGRGARRQALAQQRLRLPPEGAPPRGTAGRHGRGYEAGESFKCGHCHRFIGPLPSGGHHRNHCPFCLYSRHVDDRRSGDRASTCGSLMAPIGVFQRPNGEHVVIHNCLGCGFERFNRIAADDDFDLVLSLPVLPPRSARPEDMTGGNLTAP